MAALHRLSKQKTSTDSQTSKGKKNLPNLENSDYLKFNELLNIQVSHVPEEENNEAKSPVPNSAHKIKAGKSKPNTPK